MQFQNTFVAIKLRYEAWKAQKHAVGIAASNVIAFWPRPHTNLIAVRRK